MTAQLLAGVILISVMILAGSLAFFIGNAERIAAQILNGLITFTT